MGSLGRSDEKTPDVSGYQTLELHIWFRRFSPITGLFPAAHANTESPWEMTNGVRIP